MLHFYFIRIYNNVNVLMYNINHYDYYRLYLCMYVFLNWCN